MMKLVTFRYMNRAWSGLLPASGSERTMALAFAAQSRAATPPPMIGCGGPRIVLSERGEEETEAALELLPVGGAQRGLYSYGEISPHISGRCDLHDQMMMSTMLGEMA